jgi:hypothetical protein
MLVSVFKALKWRRSARISSLNGRISPGETAKALGTKWHTSIECRFGQLGGIENMLARPDGIVITIIRLSAKISAGSFPNTMATTVKIDWTLSEGSGWSCICGDIGCKDCRREGGCWSGSCGRRGPSVRITVWTRLWHDFSRSVRLFVFVFITEIPVLTVRARRRATSITILYGEQTTPTPVSTTAALHVATTIHSFHSMPTSWALFVTVCCEHCYLVVLGTSITWCTKMSNLLAAGAYTDVAARTRKASTSR